MILRRSFAGQRHPSEQRNERAKRRDGIDFFQHTKNPPSQWIRRMPEARTVVMSGGQYKCAVTAFVEEHAPTGADPIAITRGREEQSEARVNIAPDPMPEQSYFFSAGECSVSFWTLQLPSSPTSRSFSPRQSMAFT